MVNFKTAGNIVIGISTISTICYETNAYNKFLKYRHLYEIVRHDEKFRKPTFCGIEKVRIYNGLGLCVGLFLRYQLKKFI